MPPASTYTGGKIYLKIIDGSFAIKSEEGVERAKPREAKNPSTNEVKTVWEITELNWKGKILDINVEQGKYGKVCKIIMDDAVITLPTNSKYFSNLAEKLPNVDFSKEVILHPYNMNVDGKQITGVKVIQEGNENVQSAYWEDNKRVASFPKVDEAAKDKKGYWAMYYGEVEEYLIERLPKVGQSDYSKTATEELDINDPAMPWEEDPVEPNF